MKRVIISAVLLTAVLLWSLIGGRMLCSAADGLIADIEQIEALYAEGDTGRAYEMSLRFSEKWRRSEKLLSVMVHDEKIGELNFCAAKITPLIETDNDELTAELENIKHQLERLKAAEKRI